MTADAAAIPDAETIVADVTVDVTMDADVTMAGVLPCLAAEEAAAPAFSGLSVSCAAAEIIMDADAITMAAVTTAAGLSSCFCSAAETTDVVATIAADLSGKKRACEKTKVFSCVLLLIDTTVVIFYKKVYTPPFPIRMLLWNPMRQLRLFSVYCDIYKDCVQ